MNPSQVSSSKVKSTEPPVTIDQDPQTIKVESSPTSIEFHPSFVNILLVGTAEGLVNILDILSGDVYFLKDFFVRDSFECCNQFQDNQTLKNSVKKVTWSPSGSIFGIAYASHFVHLYRQNAAHYYAFEYYKQIDAHDGAINDISFSKFHELSTMLLITCGDDKKVNIWKAKSGEHVYTFLHDSPVCSVCPFMKQDDYYLCSASIDGNIKAWRYHKRAEGISIDLPDMGYCKMLFDAVNNRFFFSGTFKDNRPCLVEWDESNSRIKRCYKEIKSQRSTIISANGILAAVDEYQVKFWDVNNDELLTSTGVNVKFPGCPCISFNRSGSLLAVGETDNKIKILRIAGERRHRGIINYFHVSDISKEDDCKSLLLCEPSKFELSD